MASPVLVTVSWVIAILVTGMAFLSLGRGIAHLIRQFRSGGADHTRSNALARRFWALLSAVLSHREFKGRPLVRAAHWLVMLSFPLLFLTLISGYMHLRSQDWHLPLLGGFAPWHWLVDFFSWAGLLGIGALMLVRSREGRGSLVEAALSGEEASNSSPIDVRRRDGTWEGRASRFLGSTRWQALFVEWVIVLVCACVIVLQGLEYALSTTMGSTPQWWMYPLTFWLGKIFVSAWTSTAIANAIVLVSLVKILVSMLWMMVVGVQTSMGIAWHRFLAVFNVFLRRNADGSKSLGALGPLLIDGQPLRSPDALDQAMEEAEERGEELRLGVGTAEDLSWKARLDFLTCTECGRCQELCPAWNTQKPLSPKLVVLSLRDHVESASNMVVVERELLDEEIPGGSVEALGDREIIDKGLDPSPHTFDVLSVLSASGATGLTGVSPVDAPLVPEVVDEGVLWDCTMCGACVDQCPVDIEHIDHIVDLRRHQVLMEAAFPRELGKAFRGMESKGNPYNQPARKRMDWAKKLPFDVPVIGRDVEDASEVDYLFWVGCAGAYDDKAKVTTAAIAELLHIAGVSFAVLGEAESCTGDPARRAGNEVLFQMLASAAIDTLTGVKAHKIVVSCAHCFNTISSEYPELGGHFEVIHYTQLLNRLVRDGLLTPVAPHSSNGRTITYHDPCFLGRHQQIFEAPREVLDSLGVDRVEMPRNRSLAMCCGAGGARAWMEETRGIRIADARMFEAATTGAQIVATACPFCHQMLNSATGASAGFIATSPVTQAEEEHSILPQNADAVTSLPEVRDVAVLMLEAVRRGVDQ